MDGKKSKAWFVRVGPFGGLLPRSWQGFLVLIVGAGGIVGLALYAHALSLAGDTVQSQRVWLACAVGGVCLYLLAAAKSGKP